ncbi:MAG: ABC transporter substrate-binding protein [Gammaproteobacteria bacterium]|nr:ABC transporter substrate-binding protein [Gammaproteobacteria bacterium]
MMPVALGLSSCARPHDATIRFGMARLPVTLDPRFATDAASYRVNRLLYRQLVDFDDNSRVIPALAQWQLLSPTRYRFTLGVQGRDFSDGTHLTSADVKATYDFVLDKAKASPHQVSLANIERIETHGVDQVDFMLHQPDALFPGRLVIGIVPAARIASNHPLNREPIGSGPFQMLSWQGESALHLQRRADGQKISFIGVPDPTVRALKLLRGEIDLTQNDLPPELVTHLKSQPDLEVLTRPGANFAYLGFNLQDPVTRKLEVRQAIAHALNRPAIIKHVLGNSARQAEAILPPDHWAGAPDLLPYPYDPALSRELLKQAGYDAQHPLHLVYKTSSDPFRLRLATIMQQQLAEVGIHVDLRSYDWGTFYGDIKAGRFQMFSLMWVGIKLPDIFHYAFHSDALPPDGANRGRLVNPDIDQMIEAAEKIQDLPQQAAAYRALQARLHALLPYVPLWYEDHVLVKRRDIQGYTLAADGNFDGLIAVTRGSSDRRSGR